MISCESFPEAGFEVDTVSPEVGQAVYFSSCSHNAHEYEWDFGDGVVSYEPDLFMFIPEQNF
jgi:PKD repeat protein